MAMGYVKACLENSTLKMLFFAFLCIQKFGGQ
jgi:hypothetical protein